MKYNGKKIKPHEYSHILEAAFKKAYMEEEQTLAQDFAVWLEDNKKHGNSAKKRIELAIKFLSS